MSERNGTANLLSQVTAFRELKEDYSSEVAESLTAKNLQRNGIDASITDVKGWEKVNNAALQGRLDIPAEVVIAEKKASIAAGTALGQTAQEVVNQDEQNNDHDNEDDDDADDLSDDEDELLTVDELYGSDDPEYNSESALDDVLKIQENS